MPRRILVIEDNEDIARLVALHLRDLECEVRVVADGCRGLEEARSGAYDLIVLDLILPGLDGLELCRRLRSGPGYTPVLMLTARSSEIDRVLGLELGADDYLTKPFSIRELLARVKAILRRVEALAAGRSASASVRFDRMTIEAEKRRVLIDNREVDLTAKEFDLLAHFAAQPGRVYTRAQLLDSVWGYGRGGYEHTVNSHINRLRRKIERNSAKPEYILTVWGVGYKFNDALR
ncbi:MAG: response regulator transcription factor [Chromatiales bacterium]|jgi:DNA-binding response OmpR family regulator